MDTEQDEIDASSIVLDTAYEARIARIADLYGQPIGKTKIILYEIGKLICNRIPPDTQVH